MMKKYLRNVLRGIGWEIQPYQTYRGRPFPDRPWEDDREFLGIYHRVLQHTLLDRRRLYMLFQLGRFAATLPGDFAECGVYRGGSALLLSALKPADRVLYLFDSFEGMPDTDATRDHHRPGDFSETSIEHVRQLLSASSGVNFRKGFFPATTSGLEAVTFSVVHIDFDIYRSMLDACEFFYPRLVRGGCILFDDYGSPSCPGAKQAVREFCSANHTREIYLPTGQALLYNFESRL